MAMKFFVFLINFPAVGMLKYFKSVVPKPVDHHTYLGSLLNYTFLGSTPSVPQNKMVGIVIHNSLRM